MNDMLKDELYHKWSALQKHNYNVDYYRKNKSKWEKYKHSDVETMGDNEVMLRKAENSLADAKKRAARAEELRKSSFKKSDDYKSMAEAKAAGFNTGVPDTVSSLRTKADEEAGKGVDYWYQRRDIEKKQINPLEGSVAYRQALKYKGYGDAASRPAPSARVENKRAVKTKTTINPITGVEIKSTSKTGNLDWKLKPVKNKAKRKAKEFVTNWKSGASSISSAAKSASSKLGKSFLDTKIAARITNFKSPSGTTTTKSSITIGDALKGNKKPKRTLSGQPNGFVENWKQGAGDIVGAFKKKKRK